MDMPHTHPAYKGTRPATHATGDVFQTTNLRDGEYLSRRTDTAFHIRNVRQENIVPRNSYGEWERTGHLDAAPADATIEALPMAYRVTTQSYTGTPENFVHNQEQNLLSDLREARLYAHLRMNDAPGVLCFRTPREFARDYKLSQDRLLRAEARPDHPSATQDREEAAMMQRARAAFIDAGELYDYGPDDVRVGHQITTTDGSTHLARAVGAEGVQIERVGSGMTATLPWDRVFASKEIPPTFTEGDWGTPETVTVTEFERSLDAALGQLGAGAAADDPRTALDFEDENPYVLPQEEAEAYEQ